MSRAAARSVPFVRLALASAALAACASLTGCMKPLFPEDAPRTQFDNYDRMRSQFTPLEEPDVFGNMQPALRARLTPQQQ